MNPELRRNLWLEISLPRLLLTPLLLGAGFVAIGWNADPAAMARVASFAWYGFWAFALLWGGRRAAASIADELAEGTWHGQRMSSLGAWPMMIGKLLGATAFAWYAALISLAIHLATWRIEAATGCVLRDGVTADAGCLSTVSRADSQPLAMIAVALLGQALAMAIMAARHVQQPLNTRLGIVVAQLAALLPIFFFLQSAAWIPLSGNLWQMLQGIDGVALAGLQEMSLARRQTVLAAATSVEWFGHQWRSATLVWVLIGIGTGGALLAAYRTMRMALQYRSLPWAYVLVLSALVVFAAGFSKPLDVSVGTAFRLQGGGALTLLMLIGVYPALLLTRRDAVAVAQVVRPLARGQWRAAARSMPNWPVVVIAALLFAGVSMALSYWGAAEFAMRPPTLLALFGFVLRDIAIFYWWSLGRQPGRPDLSAFLTLLVLYGLLPFVSRQTGLSQILPFLLPAGSAHPLLAPTAAFAEAALVWFLVYRRWRALRPAVSPA